MEKQQIEKMPKEPHENAEFLNNISRRTELYEDLISVNLEQELANNEKDKDNKDKKFTASHLLIIED